MSKKKKDLSAAEINIKLQEAAAKDFYPGGVVTPSVPTDPTKLEPDVEDWEEYVARVLEEGPAGELEEGLG